jgi:hypothetical protein
MKIFKTFGTIMTLSCVFLYTACEEGEHSIQITKKYPADVAVAWINLQQKLVKKTPGFSPAVSGRAYAYTGFTLYEAVVPGMPGYRSVIRLLGGPGTSIPTTCPQRAPRHLPVILEP